jgi:hypothetical protein
MNPTRTDAQQGGSGRVPKLLHLLPILLRRKLLISKRYSRYSSFSRLNSRNIGSRTQGFAGAYAHVYAHAYKGLARHPGEPAEPAVTLSSQWDKRSRRVAAHPGTCWPYHHFIVETAHSPAATPPGPESVEGCAIAPLHVGTVTRQSNIPAAVARSPSAPVRASYQHISKPLHSSFPTRCRKKTEPHTASPVRVFLGFSGAK